MKKNTVEHRLDGLIALLLFGVFAACVLLVLLTGARAYRRLTDRDAAAYDRRTCTQYIATRIRQGDLPGAVSVEDGHIVLAEEDGDYVSYLYCHDGWLMELFTDASEPLDPDAGEQIMKAQALSARLEDGLLTVTVTTPGGAADTVVLALRSGQEVAP